MKRLKPDSESPTSNQGQVKLNVGGTLMVTTVNTLTKSFPESVIARMFSHPEMIPRDENHNYFIDANSETFASILDVLRTPELLEQVPLHCTEEHWWRALDFWGLRVYAKKENFISLHRATFQNMLNENRKRREIKENFIVEQLLKWFDLPEIFNSISPQPMDEMYWIIPIGVHSISVGDKTCDPVKFLLDWQDRFEEIFEQIFQPAIVKIRECPCSELYGYMWQEKSYDTDKTRTVHMSITFGEEERKNNSCASCDCVESDL